MMTRRCECLCAANYQKLREFRRVERDYYRRKAELQYMHNLYMSACDHDRAMAASKFPKGEW